MFRKSISIIYFARALGTSFCKARVQNQCSFYNKFFDSLKIQKSASTVPLTFHQPCRNYAKGKNIKKEKKKKIEINETELEEVFDVTKLHIDFQKPVDHYKEELTLKTSLRSSQGVVENFKVNFEGNNFLVQDLAEISKKGQKLYVLDFTSFPTALVAVKEVLEKSELNLNVQQDGLRLFVPIPKVTKEHREILAKKAKAIFTKCKDSVREVQNKYIKKLKNVEKLSEELKFSITDQLTELGNQQISIAENILKQKEEELLKTN